MHRVLMVANASLLDDGVESLLNGEADMEVSRSAYTDDDGFLQQVSHVHPDVILLNAEGPLEPARIFELLGDSPGLATLRVIVVRPDDNLIDVYERQRVQAAQRNDLFRLIL